MDILYFICLLIQLLVDELLHHLHYLGIISQAAVNIDIICMYAFIYLGYIFRNELLDHVANLCLLFIKLPNCTILHSHKFEGSHFSTSLATFVITCHFDSNHFSL